MRRFTFSPISRAAACTLFSFQRFHATIPDDPKKYLELLVYVSPEQWQKNEICLTKFMNFNLVGTYFDASHRKLFMRLLILSCPRLIQISENLPSAERENIKQFAEEMFHFFSSYYDRGYYFISYHPDTEKELDDLGSKGSDLISTLEKKEEAKETYDFLNSLMKLFSRVIAIRPDNVFTFKP